MRDQLNSNAFFLQLLNLNAGGKTECNRINSNSINERVLFNSICFSSSVLTKTTHSNINCFLKQIP